MERLAKAKIPSPETGIEVRRSICDICSPGSHCGLDAYVKEGRIIKIEGTEGFPGSNGKLCVRGASNRQYVYRADRLKTPLRRNGPRGRGRFESIRWEDAYRDIAARLNAIKAEHGPESVAWFAGYSKWFRPWLHRITHSFGSLNYGTESSTCFRATDMAWQTVAGEIYGSDMARTKIYIGWGCNPFAGKYMLGRTLTAYKKRGGKIIVIDPRETTSSHRLADIHLCIHPGTDGALALGMANLLIENGWIDRGYIDKHVHGYEAFKALAAQYPLEKAAQITGAPPEKIFAATEMIASNVPATAYTPSAAITHHINGYNNMRAILALLVLTGSIDREGGMLPTQFSYIETDCGFDTLEEHFVFDPKPSACREKIGHHRFPLWSELIAEFQAMDLVRQIREATPYPIKALMAFGMNHRMFPQPSEILAAIDELELVVATDLFETDVCLHADYVLPVCTSLERSELKGYSGGYLTCTRPVIEPLYQSKSDAQVICELARHLGLDDDLLKSGYESTMRYLISNLSVTLEELRAAPLPVQVKELRRKKAGARLEKGFPTPTGKLELYSERIAGIRRVDLNPLPVYESSFDSSHHEEYPFTLISGARLAHAMHSRFHNVPWARSLRREPAADLHPEDATRLGIRENDTIELSSPIGSILVKAHLTYAGLPGDVYMYHGYKEADVNVLIKATHLDPYSGFPGFRQIRCNVRKAER